jgi:hypothetical protein
VTKKLGVEALVVLQLGPVTNMLLPLEDFKPVVCIRNCIASEVIFTDSLKDIDNFSGNLLLLRFFFESVSFCPASLNFMDLLDASKTFIFEIFEGFQQPDIAILLNGFFFEPIFQRSMLSKASLFALVVNLTWLKQVVVKVRQKKIRKTNLLICREVNFGKPEVVVYMATSGFKKLIFIG